MAVRVVSRFGNGTGGLLAVVGVGGGVYSSYCRNIYGEGIETVMDTNTNSHVASAGGAVGVSPAQELANCRRLVESSHSGSATPLLILRTAGGVVHLVGIEIAPEGSTGSGGGAFRYRPGVGCSEPAAAHAGLGNVRHGGVGCQRRWGPPPPEMPSSVRLPWWSTLGELRVGPQSRPSSAPARRVRWEDWEQYPALGGVAEELTAIVRG